MTVASYHNHTRWSDGKNSVSELIDWAAQLGVDELGISDHFVLHPRGHQYNWSMDPQQVGAYINEVRTAVTTAPLQVRLGLEIDWFPGHAAIIADALDPFEFDFLIGAVHEVDDFIIDGSPHGWSQLSDDERNQTFKQYWILIRQLAESRLFDIAAHLDLPKKFGFAPTVEPVDEISAALDALAEAGTVVEINTAGWHKPCADAYPTLNILRQCRERAIPVTISADAHKGEHLLRDFSQATERLRDAGYEEIARFQCRQMRMERL